MNLALPGSTSQKRYQALALALLSATLWSTAGFMIKWVSWNPLAIAGARSAIASLALVLIIRRPRLSFSRSQWLVAGSYAATVTLFVAANKLTTAANAIVLQYTAPVFVAILGAWFLGERVRWRDWLAVAVTFAGVALFFLDRLSPSGLLGNLLALTSGVTYAILTVALRSEKDASPLDSVLLGNVLTAVVTLPFILGSQPGGAGWLGLAALGVFQLALPYVSFTVALKHITALEAILVAMVEPLLNPVWVFLIAGEVPGPWALAGGAVVLITLTVRHVSAALEPSS